MTPEEIEAIYRALPKVACQGKCWQACGLILMSRAEWERIVRRLLAKAPGERYQAAEELVLELRDFLYRAG